MKYRKLGKNGPEISVIGFGTWAIGGGDWVFSWGEQNDQLSQNSIRAALDAGINFFDTAAVYGMGHSEEVLGKALKGSREKAVIATKFGLVWDDKNNITRNGTYGSIIREAEDSLRRLGTDYIDLYQMHWPDTDVKAPLEETMRAMEKLVQDGKIRYVGVSNFPIALLDEALAVRHIDSLQPPYSILAHQVESDLLPYCIAKGIGVLAYSPLASGLLSGNYTFDSRFDEQDWRSKSPSHTGESFMQNIAIVEQLKDVAEQLGITVSQLAIAYVLANPPLTSALIGVRKPKHILNALAAAEVTLDESVLTEIRSIAKSARIVMPINE
ncbi:oxidoreductase [Paenibacillus baekrokdamisoli]|uniref:Oxidoreductase n=1 Tax=Paenibacillus baekrokdamisoli TaxID=1712516 RepID=A0A3G9ITQ0_9BACL|nr:aldo/keto reductase [Paenibacillus baekrokdamisoli]MBB3067388.1 aryl-alcohol dehydrogenase-like predicted oxidoreductase [Paenibacillus baekrokdamisoli]BBH19425.1 oxidoreductase [Paenibacillus baekrokdamisoli]